MSDYLVHYWRRMQDNNFDSLIIVSGDKGFGKSTYAILRTIEYLDKYSFICPKCGVEFYKNPYIEYGDKGFIIPDKIKRGMVECPIYKKLDKSGQEIVESGCGHRFPYSQRKKVKWDAAKFIAYDNNDVVRKVYSLPRYSPLICDEAIKFAAAMNHNKAESKEIKEIFTTIRPKRLLVFFCIPAFTWVDSKYREEMSNFWIRCLERGTAVIFEKDKGESDDKYHVEELSKIMGVVKYFTPMEKIKRNIRRHPCYFDMVSFPEIEKTVYDQYELVRNARVMQQKVEEMELSNKDIGKIMAYNLLTFWDRIRMEVDKSKEVRLTYHTLVNEILMNPANKKPIVSDTTVRGWVRGVEDYIKSKGTDVKEFSGGEITAKVLPDASIEL